ncbi:putative nuclear RNA export factor SDE5 isoform X1 [Brachypodium distachyon]|nr:putative nuclear RNA export factor SDE5 isoform X1 [Brachypodium distachyon]XP_010235767.1 putative nuclear RNA export factor SDE5 isoform X1 [Brachypodium distachyon]XP_014756452.1 putative nuclear RNA export factor SDE5 isoform X1 [Brachypodium distachyon]|eukprot:XP_010235766.1 putative nuclear RNA export factor SDE5 isoform X1 [Brachypodium distachyon]
MDIPSLLASTSDDEKKALNALLDAFSCAFSLEDIADAYCRANGDVNKAGDFLTELSMPQGNAVEPSVDTNFPQIGKVVEENYVENSNQTRCLSNIEKAAEEGYVGNSSQIRPREKSQKSSASFGTVSSMLGKGSACVTTAPVSRASEKDKPLKVELPEYMREDLKTDESDSAPKRETLNNRDVEEFLFSMLGEGFKLSMEVIREVLGSCGYDIKRSMDELMSFSPKDLCKNSENGNIVIQDMAVESSFSKGSCLGSQNTPSGYSLREDKHKPRVQISPGELLESMFTVPERSEEEPKGRRYELGANRKRVPDRKPVLKPLDDSPSSSTDLPVKIIIGSKEPVVRDEGDYQNYRRAAKQHWDMMKQYYEKAVDAFREGNQEEVEYLLNEGKNYYRMARLSDEKSAGEITKSIQDSKNELRLDLRSQDAANVANLLRLHLKQLANIPSFVYLRVIIGVDDGTFKMGQRRRKVEKFLEKKSVQWTEDELNPGTILIPINQVKDQQV